MSTVYNSFASKEQRKNYVCKSDITKELLAEMCFPSFVTVDEVKKVFDDITDNRYYIRVYTGSPKDSKRRRATKFVRRYVLYQAYFKGLRR